MDKIPLETKDDPSKKWRCFVLLLLVFSFFVTLGMAFVVIYYEFIASNSQNILNKPSSITPEISDSVHFKDLSDQEIAALEKYLETNSMFNLDSNVSYLLNRSYVFVVELYLPNKSDMLASKDQAKTNRLARVVLFRGDLNPPLVEEYIVGPLHNISFHYLLTSDHYKAGIPYLFRPFSKLDRSALEPILLSIETTIGHILIGSYEVSFYDCFIHCLSIDYFSPMAPSVTGNDVRLVWYWVHHNVENSHLHPADLFILVNMTESQSSQFKLEKIWYANNFYDSLMQMALDVESGQTELSYIPYRGVITGEDYPQDKQNNDLQTDKLVIASGKHVRVGQWEFDLHMSTTHGPSLFNVRFMDVLYAFEISLQEISMNSNGYKQWLRYSDVTYSGFLLGTRAIILQPGIHCPEEATFISSAHTYEGDINIKTFPNSFCIFDKQFDSYIKKGHKAVIVRSILRIFNNDHIFDFILHPNGILDVQTGISGYPLPSIFTPQENRYGFRLNDDLIANIHQHFYHFKVDIDVFGPINRFETLDVELKTQESDWVIKSFTKYEQLKFTRSLKMTEKEAAFISNVDNRSKFFLFYNKDHLTQYKDPRGIRLKVNSDVTVKPTLNVGNEAATPWRRYSMAVTRHHDDERGSSSIYSTWDARKPVVNFQRYMDDNENIIDQDLVSWVTLTSTHIPHTEDYPGMSPSETSSPFH